MRRAALAVAPLWATAASARCTHPDSTCSISEDFEDGVGLLQKPAADALQPRQLETCAVGDRVRCPGSDAWCQGDQCCPGTEASGHRSFPCPSAAATFGAAECGSREKLALCTKTEAEQEECLCTFDVDRTLTGEQGNVEACPADEPTETTDTAFGGGKLTWSEAGQGLCRTFCSGCFVGIVTAGMASGPDSQERADLIHALQQCGKLPSTTWMGPSVLQEGRSSCEPYAIETTLAVGCADGSKQFAVQKMLGWLRREKGVDVKPQRVWHFDDRAMNILPFEPLGYNAHQISCASRDMSRDGGRVGLCGATVEEIADEAGVSLCPGFYADDEGQIHYDPPHGMGTGFHNDAAVDLD